MATGTTNASNAGEYWEETYNDSYGVGCSSITASTLFGSVEYGYIYRITYYHLNAPTFQTIMHIPMYNGKNGTGLCISTSATTTPELLKMELTKNGTTMNVRTRYCKVSSLGNTDWTDVNATNNRITRIERCKVKA